MHYRRGRREGAERPPDDRPKRGGLRSGARADAPADLAPRMRGGCAGRSGRTEAGAPARAERSNTRGGQHTPRRAASEASGGEGGRGGGDRGQGLRAGARPDNTTAGAAHPQEAKARKFPRAHAARAIEWRAARTTSEGERGEPKRERLDKLPPDCGAGSGREETRSGS